MWSAYASLVEVFEFPPLRSQSRNKHFDGNALEMSQLLASELVVFRFGAKTIKEEFMAINLISEIAQFLGPDIVARIASGLGLDKASTLSHQNLEETMNTIQISSAEGQLGRRKRGHTDATCALAASLVIFSNSRRRGFLFL